MGIRSLPRPAYDRAGGEILCLSSPLPSHSFMECGSVFGATLVAFMRGLLAAVAVAVFLAGQFASPVTRSEQLFTQASQALAAGDYVSAESGFYEVLKLEPRNLGALGNLGVVYSRTHRYSKAIDVYNRALKLSPRDSGLLLDLGLVYLKQNDYAHAQPLFRRLHQLNTDDRKSTNLLATALVFGGKPAEAIGLLEPAARKDPDPAAVYLLGVAYYKAGQVEAGKQMFHEMLANASTKTQASFLLGHAYYDSDRFDEAEGAYRDVLRADGKFPGIHRELGKVYVSLRRNDEARKELELALQQDPEDHSAAYFLGALLVQNGLYSDGVPYLERAFRSEPDSWAACFYLGKAKLKLQDRDAAITLLGEAAQLNPDEATIFYLLGTALRAKGREQEAQAAFHRVTELHTSNLDAAKKSLEDAHVVDVR